MNDAVFRAILAMDSYNRGYRPNVTIVPGNGTSVGQTIGTAQIIRDDVSPRAQRAGFYAAAYSWNGETVISYRGTNFDPGDSVVEFLTSPLVRDIWNGWSVGAGFASGSQAGLALSFYRAVAGVNSAYQLLEDQPSISLVGHSLGGGLAGFVGALSQQVSFGYDHMPFGIAAYAQAISDSARAAAQILGLNWDDVLTTLANSANPVSLITAGITLQTFLDEYAEQYALRAPAIGMVGTNIEGEVLEGIRDGTLTATLVGVTGGLLGLVGGPIGIGVGLLLAASGIDIAIATAAIESLPSMTNQLYTAGAPIGTSVDDLTSVERHSMALLVTAMYGREQWVSEGSNRSQADWDRGFGYISSSFSSNEIARVGLKITRGASGSGDPATQMATMIAYSAINEGTRVFGDTGIRALSGDAADLGRALNGGAAPVSLQAGGNGIGALITEFAGLLAVQRIESANSPAALDGILTYRNATQARSATLMIVRQPTWDGYGRDHSIVSTDNMIEGFIQADVNEGRQILNRIERFYANANGGQDLMAAIDRVSISLGGTLPVARLAGDGVLLTVLSDSGGTSSFTGQTDFVFGGEGVDILSGMGGDDILIGGRGDDQLDGGNARDFLYGGTGQDILRGGAGGDELWSGPARDANGVAWRDELYGEEGNDLLNFSNGAGVAVGGLGNDVIDARLAAETIEVQYSIGDGTDRLMYTEIDRTLLTIDPYTYLLRDPAAGKVEVHFMDLSMADVIIQWDVTLLQEVPDEYATGATERLCVGIMRVMSLTGVELVNLGEVAGIVNAYGWDQWSSIRYAIINHPSLQFTDGYFGVGEGPNPNFVMNFLAPPTAPESAPTLAAEVVDMSIAPAFLDADQQIGEPEWLDASFARPPAQWPSASLFPAELLA